MNENNLFKPAWWLPNPHLQTLWPPLFRRNIKDFVLERERLELPDGDFIDLDWHGKNASGPIVIILHGLEGSIDSHYAKGMLKANADHGFRGVFMHFRGCSGEPNRLTRGYHCGETSDLSYVIKTLQQRGDAKLAAIGFSLGGNVLLKWLGETGAQNPLTAAVAISVPFDLMKASNRICHGFSRFYQWYFIKCLRDRLTKKVALQPSLFSNAQNSMAIDLDKESFISNPNMIYKIHTIHDFDDNVTAPIHGFLDAEEYYTKTSCRNFLKTISIPTLILHAKDDPFMYEDVIPNADELSPHITLEITESGGHVGFVTGNKPWNPEYWLEQRAPSFLGKYLA